MRKHKSEQACIMGDTLNLLLFSNSVFKFCGMCETFKNVLFLYACYLHSIYPLDPYL